MPVQLRFKTGLIGADYVTREGWRLATLERCPLHARGGCGFARHGTYGRKRPRGTRIARWRCPTGHCTFSLLPDHLAARFPGTLSEIEQVVATVEKARSVEEASETLRGGDIDLPSAMRWVRRRLNRVRKLLPIVVQLLPQFLRGCAPAITDLRVRLACAQVLVSLRGAMVSHLFQVVLFAAAYHLLRDSFDFGGFSGHFKDAFSSFFYFPSKRTPASA